MWRYLLAGCVIIAAILLTFFWSFGDPASIPHSTIPTIRPQPSPPPDPQLTAAQRRQSIEQALRQQLVSLQAQMDQADQDADRLHTRILQITRDADLARQALTALKHAQEADDAKQH